MAGKYFPLEQHLKALPDETRDVTMSFEQIEQIINDKLPTSAYKYQAWWANEIGGSHVQAHFWMDVGWKVDTVDLKKKWARFQRV